MAGFVPEQFDHLNRKINEMEKQPKDVKQLSQSADDAQQAELQSKRNQLENAIKELTDSRLLVLMDALVAAGSLHAGGAGASGRPGPVGDGGGGAGPDVHASGLSGYVEGCRQQQRDQQQQGAGAPLAPRRLVDTAAKLLPQRSDDNGVLWELTYSDRAVPYVDAGGVVDDHIRSWAAAALCAAVDPYRENAPAPLLVSGLVKTGKSYTLEHVVPAVVAEVLREQRQAEAEDGGGEAALLAGMVVLRLRGDMLDRSSGATVMLKSLLNVLLEWARQEHVPMRAGALAAAEANLVRPDIGTPSMPGEAIFAFLEAVEVPVLVLCDEVQSLFLPTRDGKLDAGGAAYMRDTFMKQLLVYGPHTMLWCLTGSHLAPTWISLAEMPPNGYAVIISICALHLPAAYSAAHMEWAWQQLQQQQRDSKPLDRRLLALCPPSIALLTVLVRAWRDGGHPSDVAACVRDFMQSKLIEESLREWKVGLEAMPSSQRLAILDMTFPAVGARTDTGLHTGLRRFLTPHLDKKADDCYYFRDSYQRQIVRMLFNKDGSLRDSWSELEFSASLTHLDCGWNLLDLGKAADYLFGPNASRWCQHEDPPDDEMDAFEAKLPAIADDVANTLSAAVAAAGGDQQQQQQQPAGSAAALDLQPQELWERQPWFQEVLNSEWNSRDREAYMESKQARRTDLDMLVFYLRLSHNMLAHTKPWNWEPGAAADVGVIEALPGVLGQSLCVFNEAMVGALQLLSRQTVQAAAAEFAVELSGGVGGGSIAAGSADDGSSSSGGGGGGGGPSRGSGGAGSTSMGCGRGGSSGSGGKGHGARAMPDQYTPPRRGPAAASGCGQRPSLMYATGGSRGRWGTAGPRRAPTLAPRLRARLSLFAPPAAVAAALGPRLPCW